MVAITALAAAASVAVAISAFITSSRAQKTANKSEDARVQAEKDRADWEYRQRFEDALVEFLKDVGVYLDRLAEPRPKGAKLPSLDRLHPSIQIVLLRARGNDVVTANNARSVLSAAFKAKSAQERRRLLADLVSNLREVVDGTEEPSKFTEWVESLRATTSPTTEGSDGS